jgi:hypothetical protein
MPEATARTRDSCGTSQAQDVGRRRGRRDRRCLDIAADLVDVPDQTTILVLSCRTGAGQHWTL